MTLFILQIYSSNSSAHYVFQKLNITYIFNSNNIYQNLFKSLLTNPDRNTGS